MPYVAINEHRIPYDIDGSEVGYNSTDFMGPSLNDLMSHYPTWASSLQKGYLNSETRQGNLIPTMEARAVFFFFLQELTEVSAISVLYQPQDNAELSNISIYGSDDSTNGIDGTWESAIFLQPDYSNREDLWREDVTSVSFSGPKKVLKIGFDSGGSDSKIAYIQPRAVHLFGRKAAGQNPDDIIFTDANGDPLTQLIDFGDVPEGTTSYQQIRVKNASATKNANNINLQLNHSDFDFSYSSSGPWVSVIDISSLGPGSLSSVIYVRNHLNPPPLALGPKAARIIASIGSWT